MARKKYNDGYYVLRDKLFGANLAFAMNERTASEADIATMKAEIIKAKKDMVNYFLANGNNESEIKGGMKK